MKNQNYLIISERLLSKLTKKSVKINDYRYNIKPLIKGKKIKVPYFGNFFDFNNNLKLTYHPKPKNQQFNDSGKWKKEGRQEIKPGKLIKYIFDNCTVEIEKTSEGAGEATREQIVNAYIESVNLSIKDIEGVQILESKDIAKIYTMESSGFLSCMKRKSYEKFVEFYENLRNCGVDVSILYTLDNYNIVTSRALLWRGVCTTGGEKINVIDRVYNDNNFLEAYKFFAEKNNYYFKKYQTFSDFQILNSDDKELSGNDYFIDLQDKFLPSNSPYMDTFFNVDNKNLTLSNNYCRSYDLSMRSTEQMNELTCICCGCELSEDDSVYNEDGECYCYGCYNENYFTCAYCGCEGSLNYAQEDVHGDYCCEHCFDKRFVKCYECGDVVSKDKYITDNYGDVFCESCYYDKYKRCECCDCEIEIDDVNVFEGCYYCENCYNEKLNEMEASV